MSMRAVAAVPCLCVSVSILLRVRVSVLCVVGSGVWLIIFASVLDFYECVYVFTSVCSEYYVRRALYVCFGTNIMYAV